MVMAPVAGALRDQLRGWVGGWVGGGLGIEFVASESAQPTEENEVSMLGEVPDHEHAWSFESADTFAYFVAFSPTDSLTFLWHVLVRGKSFLLRLRRGTRWLGFCCEQVYLCSSRHSRLQTASLEREQDLWSTLWSAVLCEALRKGTRTSGEIRSVASKHSHWHGAKWYHTKL